MADRPYRASRRDSFVFPRDEKNPPRTAKHRRTCWRTIYRKIEYYRISEE
jgi:hypothetical protein